MREAFTREGQEFGDRGDVPVCVGDFGVTDIGGEEVDHVIDTLVLPVGAHEGVAEEGVAFMLEPA